MPFSLALHAIKLEFYETDTDIRDSPIVQFCKRVHDSLSCTVHVYTSASLTDILARKLRRVSDKSARILVCVRLVDDPRAEVGENVCVSVGAVECQL